MTLCPHSLTCAVNPTKSAFENCPSALAVLYNRHLTQIAKIKILSRRPALLPLRVCENVLLHCLEHTAKCMCDLFDETSTKAIKNVVYTTSHLLWERRARGTDTGSGWERAKARAIHINQIEHAEQNYRSALDRLQELYDVTHENLRNSIQHAFVSSNSAQLSPFYRPPSCVMQELRCHVLRFFGVTYIVGLEQERNHPLATTGHRRGAFEDTIFSMAELFGERSKLDVYITYGEKIAEETVKKATFTAIEREIAWTVNKISEVFTNAELSS